MAAGSPRAPQVIFESGLPILSICYGQQTTAVQLGGAVEGGHAAEFGRAEVEIKDQSALFDGIWEVGKRYPVWMSHGDRVTRLPAGFTVKAVSEERAVCRGDRRGAPHLYDDVPPRGRAHARRRQAASELRAQNCPPAGRLDHGALSLKRGRQDKSAGRKSAGDRGAVGRRRFRRRLGADPRGDRRPAHLHLRRPWAFARERGEGGRGALPRRLQHSARPRRRGQALPRRAQGQVRPGGEAQDDRRALHRRVRGGGRKARRGGVPGAGHALPGRDRERVVHGRAVGDDQVASQRRRASLRA